VEWGGKFVLNPFENDGLLVDPDRYPKFRSYIERHRDVIGKRNVAGRNPSGWFRTIDRIHPHLTTRPKLLIPDIKGAAHVVLESGRYYPHHNLYFVTSDTWNLEVLQMILSSRVAHAFIAAYSPRMRGNFLRFQAQYLRKIRIPHPRSIDSEQMKRTLAAARSSCAESRNHAVRELYRIDANDWLGLDATTGR
jgi:hypothetical protein